MSTTKPVIGDICEIKTPRGLGYVQYTHDGKHRGDVVRVLPGLFSIRPTDFAELAKQRELYFIFYTLKYALRDGQPENAKAVPQDESSEQPITHYLYFAEESNAQKAAQRLRDRGFSVEVRRSADGKNSLVLASRTPPKTGEQIADVRAEMEAIAEELEGEYDGWELSVEPSRAASVVRGPSIN